MGTEVTVDIDYISRSKIAIRSEFQLTADTLFLLEVIVSTR